MLGRLQPAFRAFTAPKLFRNAYQQTQVAGFAQAYGKKKNADNNKFNGKAVVQDAVDSIRMNEQLRYPSMRVVYPNLETGEMEWKILNRVDALKMAQERSLDLILVNDKADPPVCKLERYGNKVKDIKDKVKEQRNKEKARALKEMFMTGGIEERDFSTKMDKVATFMRRGHQVKVTIVPKRFTKNNRFKDGVRRDRMGGFDETILMLLSYLEPLPVVVAEQKVRAPPPPTTMMVKGKKIAVGAAAPKEKVKAEKTGLVQAEGDDDGSEDADGATEPELADEPPPANDDESDDEGEGEDERMMSGGGQVGHNGQRLILRREFLLTPKSEMLKTAKTKK